jgi:hypothetical protein
MLLFMAIASVSLSDQPDSITWKWTPNGVFTVASAYQCQFLGAFAKLPAHHIGKCLAEPKSRYFTWLVLHDKVLTTENMAKRNMLSVLLHGRDHNYLLTKCNYTGAVWNLVAAKFHLPTFTSFSTDGSPLDWMRQILKSGSKRVKRKNLSILATFWWMILKERNKRIFEAKGSSFQAIAMQILESVSFILSASRPHAD